MAIKTFTDIQKKAIFKGLANKSQYQVGLDFSLDKYLGPNPIKITNAVNKIANEIRNDPEKYAVSPEVLDLVQRGMENRRAKGRTELMQVEEFTKINEKDLIVGVKNKVWMLLDKKLDYLIKNKQAFKNEKIMTLATFAGIAFDKARIVRGEATEHIALKAKIDKDITPKEAVEQLLKFRETQNKDE